MYVVNYKNAMNFFLKPVNLFVLNTTNAEFFWLHLLVWLFSSLKCGVVNIFQQFFYQKKIIQRENFKFS